jgi:predicted KAP-like P-loop ATPase
MNKEGKPHSLLADSPIGKIGDDKFGRAPFAKGIARAILAWEGSGSLVVAIYGGWGDGKSSAKGMILDDLKSRETAGPIIVEFNPWEWSSRDQLSTEFFEEIGKQIGRSNTSEAARKAESRFRLLGRFIGKTATIGTVVGGAFAASGSETGMILTAAALATKKANEFVEAVASLQGLEREFNSKTLLDVKSELRTALNELDRTVLIVVDDLDRLTADEIGLLLQLVKANSDFPKLVFLLLFQRDVVEQGLESALKTRDGREYLKKIVNAGFNLPQIPQPLLDKFVEDRLSASLKNFGLIDGFDWIRWRENQLDLKKYFRNLRDVHRFFGTYDFHLSAFSGEILEIDAIDLFSLEVVRVFEPNLFEVIASSKALLFGSSDIYSAVFDSREEQLETAKTAILAQIPEPGRDTARTLIERLFPHGDVFRQPLWQRQMRICHSSFFDRYFQLAIPQNDIRQAEILDLISSMSDRSEFAQKLLDLDRRFLAAIALQRLSAFDSKFDHVNAASVAGALFDVGDQLQNCLEDCSGFELATASYWLINAHLQNVPNSSARFQILFEAIASTEGVYLPALQVEHERHRLVQIETHKVGNIAQPHIERSQLGTLQIACAEKIAAAAAAGGIGKHPKMPFLLRCWTTWEKSEKAKLFAESLIKNELPWLLDKFYGKTPSPDAMLWDNERIPNEVVEFRGVVDTKVATATLDSVDITVWAPRQKEFLTKFRRHLSGQNSPATPMTT